MVLSYSACFLYPLVSHCRCNMSPFLTEVISTLQTYYPQVCKSNATCVSEFCHKLYSDAKKKKNK